MPSPSRATAPQVHPTLIMSRAEVHRLIDMRACIDAVEDAFRRHARGESIAPAVLGTHVDGGGFHMKTAGMLGQASGGRSMFVAKVNANFPGNPTRAGLPTIQGVIALFDATDGRVLAVLDSAEITSVRTAAATAVAARYLARVDASVVALCGCGEQAAHQLRALACVRHVSHVFAYDIDRERVERFAHAMSAELEIPIDAVADLGHVPSAADVWVTCTSSRQWFLGRAHVRRGAFVAAVGADNPEKHEIEPELMAASVVVADIVEQCAAIGDLHHALDAGVMRTSDVRGELADVVSGRTVGRQSDDEVIIFDSTGTALQDVAVAALVYERALAAGAGFAVDLAGPSVPVGAPALGIVP